MLQMFRRMPKGVNSLYLIQAFSTFAYASLYASLSLYLSNQLGLDTVRTNTLVGLFLAFNYLLHLMGGLIGGRWLSNRSLFVITTLLQSFGILFLASASITNLILGLSLFLVGCGINTTCYNSMLTQRFQAEDDRRETAFFLSYAAMNFGFCGGFIFGGLFDYSSQYQGLFYLSLLTNVMTLLLMAVSWSHLRDNDTPLTQQCSNKNLKSVLGMGLTLALIPALMICFRHSILSNELIIVSACLMLVIIAVMGRRLESHLDKQKIVAYLILAITSIVFWMIYYTGPMGITFFIKNNVDKHLFSYDIATQWILNINALVIILGAPLVTMIINRLKVRGVEISISMQFFTAFIILALSFLLLSLGIVFADKNGYTNITWVILHFISQGLAELLIAPVGFSMIGRLAPARLQGVMMGTWMMVSGVSASISHYFSNEMVRANVSSPLMSNVDYYHVFVQLTLWAMAGALFLYFISGKIKVFINGESYSPIKETSENAVA